MDSSTNLVAQATDFIYKYATYKSKNDVKKKVEGHILFRTCRIVFDEANNVCAVCLWNISPDGKVAEVLDMIIREDYRYRDIMSKILIDAKRIWPLEYLKYNRDYNDDGHDRWKKPKMFKVSSFLRRKI